MQDDKFWIFFLIFIKRSLIEFVSFSQLFEYKYHINLLILRIFTSSCEMGALWNMRLEELKSNVFWTPFSHQKTLLGLNSFQYKKKFIKLNTEFSKSAQSFTKCDFWSVNFLKWCVFGLICQLTNVGTYLFLSSAWPVSVLKYHIITHSHTSSYYLLLVKDIIVLGCDWSK